MATTSTPFIDFNAINADLLKFTTGLTGILDKLQKGEEVSALDWGKLVNDGAKACCGWTATPTASSMAARSCSPTAPWPMRPRASEA
jgi:hypothetical protein